MADLGAKLAAVKAAARPPHSQGDNPCFLYVWQGKDLQEGEFVCVAAKGVTAESCGCVAGKGVTTADGLSVFPSTCWESTLMFGRGIGEEPGKQPQATIMAKFTVWVR